MSDCSTSSSDMSWPTERSYMSFDTTHTFATYPYCPPLTDHAIAKIINATRYSAKEALNDLIHEQEDYLIAIPMFVAHINEECHLIIAQVKDHTSGKKRTTRHELMTRADELHYCWQLLSDMDENQRELEMGIVRCAALMAIGRELPLEIEDMIKDCLDWYWDDLREQAFYIGINASLGDVDEKEPEDPMFNMGLRKTQL